MTTRANDNDPRVSDAYREIANEQTPAELDRKILAMAAAEARGSRGLPRAWFRPLAWAATIALSFALVLEITQVDDIQPDNVVIPRSDADLAGVSDESAELPAAAADAAGKQEDEVRMLQQLNKRSADAPAAAKAAIAPAEPEVLREAEEQASLRAEPGRAVSAAVERKEQSDGCSEDARTSVETWYECVRNLRDAGQTDRAQQEFEELLLAFPDFREPPGDQ